MRPTKNEYFIAMAIVVSTRATCLRRHVGCVMVDTKGHVLSTGYNGRPSGWPHCDHENPRISYERIMERSNRAEDRELYPHACVGAFGRASGTDLDACDAIHAEGNALLQCRDVSLIRTCYSTTAPCVSCVKLLLNTGCKEIVFMDDYAGSGKSLWTQEALGWICEPGPAR